MRIAVRTVWLSSPARAVLGGLPQTLQWVFSNRRGDSPVSGTALLRFWWGPVRRPALRTCGLHDLRHSYASLAFREAYPFP